VPRDLSARQTQLHGLIAKAPSLAAASRNVSVTTQGGTVVLRGTVGTLQEKQLAEALLRLEPGVFDIRNEITVASGAGTEEDQ
jgi:osmotically-inducible protein OsmY